MRYKGSILLPSPRKTFSHNTEHIYISRCAFVKGPTCLFLRTIKMLLYMAEGKGTEQLLQPLRRGKERNKARRRGQATRKRWEWKGKMGWSKSAGELWLLCSMLLHMAPLPNSPKRPGLRFGPLTKRWISAFFGAFFLFPPWPDFTHAASINLVRVCWFLKWVQSVFMQFKNLALCDFQFMAIFVNNKHPQSQLRELTEGHHSPPPNWYAMY